MTTQIAIKRGKVVKGNCLSEMWGRNFLKRNPTVSLRASQNFGLVRTFVTRETIEAFYARLLETMTANAIGSLLEKPHLIFNCDESGFEFDAINKIVAAARGAKHIPRVSKGQHEKVTVLACASAAGSTLPPMFVYKSLSGRVPNGVQEGAPAGTLFTAQKSGWIDKNLYLKWFTELFLTSIPAERPILLLVDGHKAHVTQEVIESAAENQVLVFCLPAHSSHLLQPLDLSLFGPLKRGWVRACAAFSHITSTVVNQRIFAKIFNIAWHSGTTPEVIRGGFKRSGIFPFDPTMFDYGKLAPTIRSTSTSDREQTTPSEMPVVTSSGSVAAATTVPANAFMPPAVCAIPPVSVPCPELLQGDPWLTAPEEVYFVDTVTSSPEVPEVASVCETFVALEKNIGRTVREKFRRRFQNGYDVPGDHEYYVWRDMFVKLGGEDDSGACPCKSACSCPCAGIGFCECFNGAATSPTVSSPVVRRVVQQDPLTPPNATQPFKISTPSGDVQIDEELCSIMLQPMREVSGKRKRVARNLDPGNKCITGQVFLEALRSENARKEREQKEKEEKKKERARASAEKKKKAEEKKEKLKEKAEKKQEMEEKKKARKEKKKKSGAKNGAANRKKLAEIAEEKESYHFEKCSKAYVEDEDCSWIECDFCSAWFHVFCTDLPILDELDSSTDFTCEMCEAKGFRSHNEN